MAIRSLTVMVLLLGLVTATATATATFSSAAAAALALQCKAEYTAVALLSCQETLPQSPTASCCDALLYALDIWPGSIEEGLGLCCLCTYMVDVRPFFDLASAYVSCRGQDAPAVMAWLATTPTLPENCDDVCRPGRGTASPPPPPPSPPSPGAGSGSGSGRGGGAGGKQRRRQHQHVDFGAGIIVGIVLGCLVGLALLVWCLYCTYFRVVHKLRKSPDPSTRGSGSDSSNRGALEMGRVSSSRRSTSGLLT